MGRGRNQRRVEREGAAAARVRGAGRGLAALGLVGLLALAGREAWRLLAAGEALRIREIRFEGRVRASAEELLELSPVKPGESLLFADPEAVARALRRHPWVASAEVRRAWPPALVARIREREAAALLDLGGLYLLSPDLEVFRRAEPGDGLDLPVITGLSPDEWTRRRADVEPRLRAALRLVRAWAGTGLAARLPLAEIHLGGDDELTAYAGEEGMEIRLGGGDPAPKLERLAAVLAALRADGRRAERVHLDNRAHPSWVTVRPAGALGPRVAGSAR